MVSLLDYQGMKSCKSTESFCLSILTIYTNDWSTVRHVYWCHVYFFFCEIPKHVQTKNRLAHLDWDFMEAASKPVELAWDGKCRLTRFHPVRNFLANKSYLFSRHSNRTGCLFTWAVHSM